MYGNISIYCEPFAIRFTYNNHVGVTNNITENNIIRSNIQIISSMRKSFSHFLGGLPKNHNLTTFPNGRLGICVPEIGLPISGKRTWETVAECYGKHENSCGKGFRGSLKEYGV